MYRHQRTGARGVARGFSVLIAFSLAWTAGCLDNTGPKPAGVDNLPDIPGLTVSAPVAAAFGSTNALVGRASDESLVYVSLAPESVLPGLKAKIEDVATGRSVTTDVVNGGFDPVAIPASVGDTLTVEVTGATGVVSRAVRIVAARRPPVIVRIDPPPRKRDVPLNAHVVIVFSEPIDATTLTSASVTLMRGTTPVPGTVRFADDAHLRAEVEPDVLLDAATDYQLTVTEGIRGVNGMALESRVVVTFTTGTTAPATGLVFVSVSVGLSHTCGVTAGGEAYCWGDNSEGALGNGTTANSATPVRVAGGLTFASLSAGLSHTCGLTTARALYCWGGGRYIQLGAGSTPVRVAGQLAFAAVSVGVFNACAVAIDGTAYCWGQGGMGELGAGDVGGSLTPVMVAGGGLAFATVSAGVYSTCGVTTAGAGYCWGNNALGGLGTGSLVGPEQCYDFPFHACSRVPVPVVGGHTFKQVEAKVYAACGLTTDGATYCWGSNLNDALGLGTISGPEQCAWSETYFVACVLHPVEVPGSPAFVSLAASEQYTCGLTSAGVAYCWGHPQNTGDLLSKTAPVEVPGGLTFATLSAGPYSTCGVTTAGVAYCWGANDVGQLGDGTTKYSNVPVRVAGQRAVIQDGRGLQRVEVTTVTTGVALDPDGYAVENDPWDYDYGAGMLQPIPTNGTANIYLTPGPHFLGLAGVAANCDGENIHGRTITVQQGVVAKLTYEVLCTEPVTVSRAPPPPPRRLPTPSTR